MRRSSETSWLEDKGFIGVSMKPDFTAEHEFGIKDIYHSFEISHPEEMVGIERRRIKANPEGLVLKEMTIDKNSVHCLVFSPYMHFDKKFVRPQELSLYREETLSSAWDERSFGVIVSDDPKTGLKNLKKLHAAFEKKDIAIWLGGGGSLFSGPGLSIGIISAIPYHHRKTMEDADKDNFNLRKAAEGTGIKDKLSAANKKYFALSPRWKDDQKKEVIFWLNPMEQNNNNCGWFEVADLLKWIEGTGPIPKKGEK